MKRRTRAGLLSAILLAAVLTGCGKKLEINNETPTETPVPTEKFTGYIFDAFDTVISLSAYCASQEEFDGYRRLAEDEFLRWHKLCDIYQSYPELCNLRTVNDSAGQEAVTVSDELMDFLLFAKEMYTVTDGHMNVAMGSVLKIWHDIREYNSVMTDDIRLPEREELLAAAEHCDIDELVLDPSNGTVLLRDAAMSLDVGACAKGYATEKVTELLTAAGCETFALNAGGNVRVHGTKPNGQPWVIAVTDPDTTSSSLAVGSVEVSGGSVVTSGTYQRFFELEGRRYHHIIDGETLMPENRYLSVTVTAENSGYADALSTALFNMEPEEGLCFVEGLDGVEALWIMADGTLVPSSGFQLKE